MNQSIAWIDDVQAGYELDSIIAREVYGVDEPFAHYSTNHSAALDLIDMFNPNESGNVPWELTSGKYYCVVHRGIESYRAEADTYELAVCRAVLKAFLSKH